jgi:hypothetical protein
VNAGELIEKLKKVPPETEVILSISVEAGGLLRFKDNPDYVHIEDREYFEISRDEDKL